MPRDAEQAIQAALARGAFAPERAAHYRRLVREGLDPAVIDELAGVDWQARQNAQISAGVFMGDRDPRTGQRVVTSTGVTAGTMGSNSDPMFASNPLLAEMSASHPSLVAAARQEDANVPELFGDSPLPAFTANGLPPEQLASLPWPLRRHVAEAATLAKAYELVEYTDDLKLLAMRFSRVNAPYVEAFSQWLVGTGRVTDPETGESIAASAASADDLDDYTEQSLHDELFGAPQPAPRVTWPR
jgi:hypothetical protein